MKHYLTNTALHNEQLCIEAAKNSGFDVRFEREPMPPFAPRFGLFFEDEHDAQYDRIRNTLIGQYGCVVTYEGGCDHGPFWDEWDRLKALGKNA